MMTLTTPATGSENEVRTLAREITNGVRQGWW